MDIRSTKLFLFNLETAILSDIISIISIIIIIIISIIIIIIIISIISIIIIIITITILLVIIIDLGFAQSQNLFYFFRDKYQPEGGALHAISHVLPFRSFPFPQPQIFQTILDSAYLKVSFQPL